MEFRPNALTRIATVPDSDGGALGHAGRSVGQHDVLLSSDVCGRERQRRSTSPSSPSPAATFTTSTPPNLNCPCSIWSSSASRPAKYRRTTPASVELGLKFRSAVRWIHHRHSVSTRALQNTGTHVGNMWTRRGRGWDADVRERNRFRLAAGDVLAARASAREHGVRRLVPHDRRLYTLPTRVLPVGWRNERPASGSGKRCCRCKRRVSSTAAEGSRPAAYASANYWVDVVFDNKVTIDTTPPTVVATTPSPGRNGRAPALRRCSATFSEDMNPRRSHLRRSNSGIPSNMLVQATVSYDAGNSNRDPSTARRIEQWRDLHGANRRRSQRRSRPGRQRCGGDVVWSFTIAPPAPFSVTDTLAKRLRSWRTRTAESIWRRLATAK